MAYSSTTCPAANRQPTEPCPTSHGSSFTVGTWGRSMRIAGAFAIAWAHRGTSQQTWLRQRSRKRWSDTRPSAKQRRARRHRNGHSLGWEESPGICWSTVSAILIGLGQSQGQKRKSRSKTIRTWSSRPCYAMASDFRAVPRLSTWSPRPWQISKTVRAPSSFRLCCSDSGLRKEAICIADQPRHWRSALRRRPSTSDGSG